jgi:hypothetical protein
LCLAQNCVPDASEWTRAVLMRRFEARQRRCCTSLWFEDSLGESSGLDGCDEQAAPSPLPYHELAPVQPCA